MSKKKEETPIKNTMSDKTRYTIIFVVVALFLALIIGLIVIGDKDNNNTNNVATAERNTSTEALVNFYKAFDSEDLKVIYFASSTCGYCSLEKPILEQIASDYNFTYYAIDASELTNTELQEIVSALGIKGATPTTVIVQKGKVIATNEGYLDGKQYVSFFAQNKIIEDDAEYLPEKNLKDINYDDYKKLVKSKDTSLVFLDTTACEDCIEVRSMLNSLAEEHDFTVNYLSAIYLSNDEIEEFVKGLKDLGYDDKAYKEDETVNIPLLLIIKDKKIVDYVLQSTDEDDYIDALKDAKVIK